VNPADGGEGYMAAAGWVCRGGSAAPEFTTESPGDPAEIFPSGPGSLRGQPDGGVGPVLRGVRRALAAHVGLAPAGIHRVYGDAGLP